MSKASEKIIKTMVKIRDFGLIPLPDVEDTDINMLKARVYNRKHPFVMPKDKKAGYQTIHIGGYDCLIITPKTVDGSSGGILYLHGGGNKNTWKEEIVLARKYGEKTGRMIYYPLYPAISQAPVVKAADYIYALYMHMYDEYKGKVSVIGSSYGGLLAFQLITWINRNGIIHMPERMILHSPFALCKTQEEWDKEKIYSLKDPMVGPGSMKYMKNMIFKADRHTPDYAVYPSKMDFHHAPETFVYYGEETCLCIADSYRQAYEKAGAENRMHMKKEMGLMHCYACMPIFKESRRDYAEQIHLLRGGRS